MAWRLRDVPIQIADSSVLTATGDFCLGGWYKIIDGSGTAEQHLIGWNTVAAINSLNIYWHEDSRANPHNLSSWCRSDDANTFALFPGITNEVDVWVWVLIEISGTEGKLYRNNVAIGTDTNIGDFYNHTGNFYFGAEGDGGNTLNGALADWFKIDRALSSSEKLRIFEGKIRPRDLRRNAASNFWHVPMQGNRFDGSPHALMVYSSGVIEPYPDPPHLQDPRPLVYGHRALEITIAPPPPTAPPIQVQFHDSNTHVAFVAGGIPVRKRFAIIDDPVRLGVR